MATLKDPISGAEQIIDQPFKAARMALYPAEAAGEYRLGQLTGLLTGLAANAEVFQFRWTSATHLCALRFLKVRYAVITGFTAAQELAFDALQCMSWSASGTGGTAIPAGGANLKKDSSKPDSKIGDLRIATTAALGIGTKTGYTNPFMSNTGKTLAAAATVQDAVVENILDLTGAQDAPVIFRQNEGFAIRNSIAMGAAGTVRCAIEAAWSEFDNNDYLG